MTGRAGNGLLTTARSLHNERDCWKCDDKAHWACQARRPLGCPGTHRTSHIALLSLPDHFDNVQWAGTTDDASCSTRRAARAIGQRLQLPFSAIKCVGCSGLEHSSTTTAEQHKCLRRTVNLNFWITQIKCEISTMKVGA